MSAMVKAESGGALVPIDRAAMRRTLQSSLYPGASDASVDMVLAYCEAAKLDVMQKPVHIVPMWDAKERKLRDVIMPGVGLYRTQAARSGCAGITEPEFGEDITETIGGASITFPSWCRVTVKRRQAGGQVDEFTAREFWKENYAIKGGQEKSIAPNAMWTKRPYGQLAKCAEAQALRKAFPEIGAQPTAEEMEGKVIEAEFVVESARAERQALQMPRAKAPDQNTSKATADEGAGRAEASAEAKAADAGTDASQAEAGFVGLSDGQLKLLRAKAKAAGLEDDAAILAAHPRIDKAGFNAVLAALKPQAAA